MEKGEEDERGRHLGLCQPATADGSTTRIHERELDRDCSALRAERVLPTGPGRRGASFCGAAQRRATGNLDFCTTDAAHPRRDVPLGTAYAERRGWHRGRKEEFPTAQRGTDSTCACRRAAPADVGICRPDCVGTQTRAHRYRRRMDGYASVLSDGGRQRP